MDSGGESSWEVAACSCVAAVSVEKGETRDTLLAIMESDDGVVRLESANGSSHPVAGLALSWTRVMERMPAIAA